MDTYKCTNCFGTFEGLGIYGRFGYGDKFCPQCAVIKQQEKQYEEQREINDQRDRERRQEEERRYWEDYDRRNSYNRTQQSVNSNNQVGGFDPSNPEHFNKFMEIVERKILENRKNSVNTSSEAVIPQNNNFNKFANSTSNIDAVSNNQPQKTTSTAEQNYQTFLNEERKPALGISIIHFLIVFALGALGIYLLEYIIWAVMILILVLPPILSLLGIFLFKK